MIKIKSKNQAILYFIFLFLQIAIPCFTGEPSEGKLKTLYNSLNPTSVSQHLAFYELYSQTPLGQQALRDAWTLLMGNPVNNSNLPHQEIPLSPTAIYTLVSLVNKPMDQETSLIPPDEMEALQKFSQRLHHTSLKGHHVWTEQEVLNLPLNEIDVARGLFISQFGDDRAKIQSYEALIDLMALQILARLPKQATEEQKIRAINGFIFDEMGFRFPPHSLSTKKIDLYSFLPSVLDSRRGVCLGVSILYICLAQRLDLSLEMITPPGHIYVRYRSKEREINIETTARGIHIDSEDYLDINTRSLQQRTTREVIGMAHFNQASVFWQNSDYPKVLQAYQKAEPYLRGDPLLKELMGYAYLLTGHQEEGEKLIRDIKDHVPDYAIVKNTIAEDYLAGKVDPKGIGVIFSKADEERESIIAKKQALEETLARYPQFRSGMLNLAVMWLQLHRAGEALETLEHVQTLDKNDPEVHYYLSTLYAQRRDYPNAWRHLQQTEDLLRAKQHYPKDLKELRRELISLSPE